MSGGSGWLTVAAAAERVSRSERTIYRWSREGLLPILLGRVNTQTLLEVDVLKRGRVGRPRKLR